MASRNSVDANSEITDLNSRAGSEIRINEEPTGLIRNRPIDSGIDDGTLSNESSELVEPKFDYQSISRENDLSQIVKTDTITCSCLHSKLFAVGTARGRIHVLDFEGIKMDRQDLCPHLRSVNCISIDEKGEYLVSCSSDKLVVFGLCNNEHNFVVMTDKPMNVVAIDPSFHRAGNGRRFVSGDDKVILYERGFLARYKSTVLQSKEQTVRSISWHGQFIAWATDLAVQIFDLEQRSIITRIRRDSNVELSQSKEPCQFCWKDKRTFLVGWSNTVKVCIIKERSHEVLNETQLKELPKKYVEIVSMFETNFTICGLAPFKTNLFALSMQMDENPEQQTVETTNSEYSVASNMSSSTSIGEPSGLNQSAGSSSNHPLNIKPQVLILETYSNNYKVISQEQSKVYPTTTATSAHLTNRPGDGFKKFPFTLLSSHEDGIYLIVGPKDVISAKPRNYDDHIDWLINRNQLRDCCQFARDHANDLTRYSVRQVEELYMEDLLSQDEADSFSEAARLCQSICGSSHELWDYNIRKFNDLGQLKHLLPNLPCKVEGFHLSADSYNFILNEFLGNDSVSFFKAIKEIPSNLYSLQTMTDQVIRNLANDPKNLVLNEALAELYTRMGKFEDAVNIYLDYNDKNRIFSLIRNNNLVSILRDRVDRLMQIDADQTSQLLVENIESIPLKDVVERLERYKSKRYLVAYLHRLVLKDPDCCIEYHDLMVKLYAQHQRESLLNFLKLSTNYRLEEALRICKESNLIREVVFLHGRMGDLRVALKYITESQGDIGEAIEFCKEHQDPDLWQDLILYSMDRPEFIGALLENIGTHINDPIELIDRIPNGCEIEGLMPALVKILQDYQLQISLERSLSDLMAKDCFSLLEKQIRCQTQGIAIREDQLCDHCNQPLMADSVSGGAMVDNLSQTSRSLGSGVGGGGSTGAGLATSPSSGALMDTTGGTRYPSANQAAANDLVIFGCHHVFHEECCTESAGLAAGEAGQGQATAGGAPELQDLANKMLSCRVCMLEKDFETGASASSGPTAVANLRTSYEP